MSNRRIIGVIVVIVGIGMLFGAHHIKKQVEEGKGKVHNAQKGVDTANSLFSSNRATKQAGKAVTDRAQMKINEGKGEINRYSHLVKVLQVGGIIFIIGGGCAALVGTKKRHH